MSANQTEINKAAVRRFADVTNTHDPQLISKAVDEVFDTNMRAGTQMPIEADGPEDVKRVFATLHAAFPDLHISIEDVIAEGDRVVCRERITGTHSGSYMGLPATGKNVAYNEITIARFADGRIVETWGVVDMLSLMKQLGAIPTGPGQPGIDASRVERSQRHP
jgi:steroid delta-isomerase-like uncharacterized protein